MKILIIDTYYPTFLRKFHHDLEKSEMNDSSFFEHKHALIEKFGTSDFYSRHLNLMGLEATDIIANDFCSRKNGKMNF